MIKWIKRLIRRIKSRKRKKQMIQHAFLQEAAQIEKEIMGIDIPVDLDEKERTRGKILEEAVDRKNKT